MNIRLSPLILAAVLCGAPSIALCQAPELVEPEMEVHDLFGMEGRNFRPGIVGRAVNMATVRLSRIEISEGHSTPDHNHADEEIVLLLEGSIQAFMGEKSFIVKPGELITIPAYVPHHYVALEDSVTIEAFGPGRNLGGANAGQQQPTP